ncbi:hypothetical protein 8014-B2_00118 [Lactobacillus phage ATCC 8014-B2]|uniref:Uncharacterized protein n=1 Tax=Lactobacillus phage ATCC 8014-B2 TaxID=1225795 RepID=K4I4H6_9CAUD|nr:hypothetical protein HOQ89_gp028 [Lactobacillus phage ATCC 8014-B2]AFU63185.1 hypothetical protein 8014-B2_00118 [Lactobacillus phage ATCC 8014-B2]
MKLNAKAVEMLLRGSNHFEIVSQLDMYGNGSIVEVNTHGKIYNIKSNYQGTDTHDVIIADNVNKEIKQFISILKDKGYQEL